MSVQRLGLWIASFALATVLGCRCGGEKVNDTNPCGEITGAQPNKSDTCGSNDDCADHYTCVSPKDKAITCCMLADRKCNTEADCCPGQTCPSDRKKCFDKYLACDTDADCGDKGDRFCEQWTDSYGTSSRCRFKQCSGVGECPEGQACFKGECMADLPCSGTCEGGKACVPAIDRCQEYACPATCAPGFIATFNDNRNIWDACNLPAVACECSELPGLHSGDQGRYSAAAADFAQNQVVVSHYDGEYGDLVVNRYDSSGQLSKRTYVDGVPQGAIKYGPSGARGGIVEPGEDVGRYTDVAVGSAATYVSYYDATSGNLKLAYQTTPSAAWTILTVDGNDADLGLYTSIAVDSDGLPAISYWQRGGGSNFNVADCPAPAPTGDKKYITALKFAKATTATPTAPTDFTFLTLACESRPAPACEACTDICADTGSGTPGCYPAATSCTGCDPNTEACVTVGASGVCGKKYNPSTLADVSDGVGLFTSLSFSGKDAYIAYMHRKKWVSTDKLSTGRLYGIRIASGATAGTRVLLDGTGDTGFFPDVKIEPSTNNVLVSYHDFTSRALKFYRNANFTTGVTPEIIDPGAGPAGSGLSAWVGTDSAIVVTASGKLYVVYQDATGGDLKLAIKNAGWEVQSPIRTDGAVGFFADGVALGNKLYASHARIHAKLIAGEPKVDNALILDTRDAP